MRETEEESEVVANLMIGFGIDEVQAEYVAEIKLRHLNREYILKRTQEIEQLEKDIAEMEEILADSRKIKKIIIGELQDVIKKYAQPRKSLFVYPGDEDEKVEEEEVPDYPVNLFLTEEGYFKKITPQSLRMSSEQKLKEGDKVAAHVESTNTAELLFFSDRCQVYKTRACDFDDAKASVLGEYIPAKLGFDEGEKVLGMVVTTDYKGQVLFFFQNGKVAKVPLSAYETKTRRKKLTGAYSDKSPVVALFAAPEDGEYVITSSATRKLLFHTSMIALKTTKNTQGVQVMTLKKNHFVTGVEPFDENAFANPHRYRTRTLPAAGAIVREEDLGEQLML